MTLNSEPVTIVSKSGDLREPAEAVGAELRMGRDQDAAPRDLEGGLFDRGDSWGSGVVKPCSTEIPLVPEEATSITRPASISVAQWSTVARVQPCIRPPSSNTVTVSLFARASAASSDEVTTVVRGPRGARRSAAA